MKDQQAIRFYTELLSRDDRPVQNAVESMVEEAEATRGHFTLQEALAVLIVNRRLRGILSGDEAVRVFARLIAATPPEFPAWDASHEFPPDPDDAWKVM